MQEATKVSEEQIAANVREAARAFNTTLEVAEKAGVRVVWAKGRLRPLVSVKAITRLRNL